jgi:hypothetical protein
MKLRTQRVHHMGSSNRDFSSILQDSKNVFEKSYIKSHSSYYKPSQSLTSQEPNEARANNPFQGTHVEHESVRWNTNSKKIGSASEWKL